MIACFDVHYTETQAAAAAVLFDAWTDRDPAAEYLVRIEAASEYKAGQFYRRELNPLLAVIDEINQPIDTFVIDAYCTLSPDGAPGLGAHLHDALDRDQAVIIGVAKNRFRETTHAAEVHRGGSSRPLFVTAIGIDTDQAAAQIGAMAGEHRIPRLLKRVDQLARQSLLPVDEA